jgi:hypothetical protein
MPQEKLIERERNKGEEELRNLAEPIASADSQLNLCARFSIESEAYFLKRSHRPIGISPIA